jgi:hypothetical protein
MRRRGWIALTMVATLAACSKPTPGRSDNAAGANGAAADGNAAAGNTAAPAGGSAPAATAQLNPGEWETAVEMKMTGMPPEVAKAMAGQKIVTRHCLTPEKAAKPSGDLFSGKPQQGCERKDWAMSGGRVHGALACKDPRGGSSTVTMDGQYGGDSFDVRMSFAGEQGGRSITWESHSVGRRVAPACSAATKDD